MVIYSDRVAPSMSRRDLDEGGRRGEGVGSGEASKFWHWLMDLKWKPPQRVCGGLHFASHPDSRPLIPWWGSAVSDWTMDFWSTGREELEVKPHEDCNAAETCRKGKVNKWHDQCHVTVLEHPCLHLMRSHIWSVAHDSHVPQLRGSWSSSYRWLPRQHGQYRPYPITLAISINDLIMLPCM